MSDSGRKQTSKALLHQTRHTQRRAARDVPTPSVCRPAGEL